VGGTADSSYELVFDAFLGKNEPPNVAGPRCAGLDLTGVWQSQTYSHFEVRAGGENVTVVPDAARRVAADGVSSTGVRQASSES